MKYLIFIIIFLLLVGAVVAAVVFLRKKQAENTQQKPPFTPMPPVNQSPQVNHQADEPIPTLNPMPTQAQPNYLQKAQLLIDQQRFSEAEQELKRGLTATPNNGELSIKLLNLYAMNHQHDDFNTLYDKIRTQGDTSTLNQANRLKSLVDAEQAAKAETTSTAPAAQAEIIPDEGLDFDLSLDEPSSDEPSAKKPVTNDSDDDVLDLIDLGDDTSSDLYLGDDNNAPAQSSDTDDSLSFDDLESQLLDTPVTTEAETKASDDAPLELTLDGLGGIDEEDKAQLEELEPSLSINNDSLELEDSNKNDTANDMLSLDDDAFSLDIADTDNHKKTEEQPVETSEIDLSESLSESEPVSSQSDTNDDMAFDWGLEDDNASTPTTEKSESPKTDSNEFSLDDAQLDWGLEEETSQTKADDTVPQSSQAPVAAETDTTDITGTDDDFALNIDESESVQNIDDHHDGELSFEDLELNSESSDDKEAIADLEQDLNQGFDFNINDTDTTTSDESKSQATQPTAQEPAESTKESDGLSLGGDFDAFDAIEAESLSLDDTTTTDTAKETTSDTPAIDSTPVTPTVETQAENLDNEQTLSGGVEDTLSQLDALNFDDIYNTETEVEEERISDIAPVAKEAPVKGTSSTSDAFSSDFGFVNNLDGAQVTLELAVQYLDLGEYESAKRLLNEVIQQGDSQQQDLAKELLAKAG